MNHVGPTRSCLSPWTPSKLDWHRVCRSQSQVPATVNSRMASFLKFFSSRNCSYLLVFAFEIFYWRIIALQCHISFCCTTKRISYASARCSVVSNSLWPHGLYSPRNPPGQNTGRGGGIAFPFSRGSSQPRGWTQVSHIAGRFFTSWATREAQEYWSG